MNRWQINKYGFVNFWLFDREEIRTYGGNLLLTGENGSGKSVTLQSFIPLIFDGNTSSRRLSTEGDSSRQMEYYLLYGDKKEAISYIYAEFVKKDENGKKSYITLAIGMKLRHGQGTPKKWFVIAKDQRVGKGLELYKQDKDYIEPYDKMDLKRKLEGNSVNFEFYDNANEYKQAVNNNLFGFRSIDEFEETIDLIVELRQPNLRDNTGFDPKYIYDILNKSLKVISEKDLKSISDTFEKIEEISEELKLEKRQFDVLTKIDERYKRYKKIVLAKGLADYREKLNAYEKNKADIEDSKKNIEKLEASIQKGEERIEKLRLEQESKRQELLEIQDKSQSIIDRKRAKTIEFNNIQSEIENIEKRIEKTNKILKDNIELKLQGQRDYEESEKEYLVLEEEIRRVEEEIAFDSNMNYLNLLEDKKENAFTTSDFNFENHKRSLEKLFSLLNTNREYKEKIIGINNDLAKEENDLFRVTDKRKELEGENSERIREYLNYLNGRTGKILNLNYGEIQEVIGVLEEFDQEEFNEILRKNLSYLKDDINREMNEYKRVEERLLDELEDIKDKQKTLETEEDVKIDMLSHKEEERRDYKNIKALYEVIRFKDGLSIELEGRIEKALWEMGLLDALVTEKTDIFDKLLLPKEKKSDNLTKYLEAESDCNQRKLVEAILESISILPEGEVYITEEGIYKNSLIEGRVNKWKGRYIGIETRKKMRMRQIEKLKEESEKLEERLDLLRENLSDVKKKLISADEEYQELTQVFKDNFRNFYEIYNSNLNEITFVTKRIEKYKIELLSVEKKRDELLKKLEGESKKLGLEISEFDTVRESLREFENLYQKIKDKYKLLVNIYKHYKSSETMERTNEEKLEEEKKSRRILLKKKEELEDIILNLEREIEEKGHTLAVKRIEELDKEIFKIIPNRMDEIGRKISSQETKAEGIKSRLEEALNKKEEKESEYNISNSLIREELNKTDHGIDNSLYHSSQAKLSLYEEYKEYTNMSYAKDFALISQQLSKYELLLKPFGLKLEEYSYLDTREKYSVQPESRERYILKAVTKGRNTNFQSLIDLLREQIGRRNEYLNEEEQKFFKEMLFSYINKEIADRIKESKDWVKRIDSIMKRAKTNSGKRYSLKWTSKNVGFGLNGEDIYQSILNLNNPSNKGIESENLIKEYFNKKTKELKRNAENENSPRSSYEILREVLDYRMWYGFNMSVIEDSTGKTKPLNKRKLNSYSGGEKAMAMYIPLFSALYARFGNALETSPMIITMDEAFSVVDDENIAKLFEILEDLELNYLLASQKLSGTYDTVKRLAIVYIENMTAKRNLKPSEGFITLIKYLWDGVERKRDLRGEEGGQRLLF